MMLGEGEGKERDHFAKRSWRKKKNGGLSKRDFVEKRRGCRGGKKGVVTGRPKIRRSGRSGKAAWFREECGTGQEKGKPATIVCGSTERPFRRKKKHSGKESFPKKRSSKFGAEKFLLPFRGKNLLHSPPEINRSKPSPEKTLPFHRAENEIRGGEKREGSRGDAKKPVTSPPPNLWYQDCPKENCPLQMISRRKSWFWGKSF